MEIESSYVHAIQAIAGKTPGEKQKTINSIAREIAQAKKSGGHSVDAKTQIPDVPEPLKPLVCVEVAKILHQYEGIIEAFKCEDMTVVSRALQAKWFFDGSDTSLVNAQNFLENVLPEISLYARLRIVKNLGLYLKNTVVAAGFFRILAEQYGASQAVPLLVACDEDFAFEMIIKYRIVLSLRMVETLFRKYPNLVIKYLMLCKPDDDDDDDDIRDDHRINIDEYNHFLPELANKRFEDFMEIYRMHNYDLNVELGKKATRIFIKTQLNLLVEKPDKYLNLVPLRTVTRKLCAGDFTKMFRNLFSTKEYFRYRSKNEYLQYYKPEREKIPLILNTFREVYGKDLLDCKDLVDSDLMQVLPTDDRVKQARLKLEDDKEWHLYDLESSWRCYLPTSESIPVITAEIRKSSDSSKRGQLLYQLIYTSKVNDDRDALLKVLNYIYDRHRNEQKSIFYTCLSKVCDSFDLATLGSTHWEILDKYIKLAEMQDELCNQVNTMSRVLEAALHYCLLNNLPTDDYVRIVVDIKIQMYHSKWNVLTKYPNLEKKFLDLFIDVIPKQYPPDNKIWEDCQADVIRGLASSLWDFNKRNKFSKTKFQKLSIKEYPWLLDKIKTLLLHDTGENQHERHLVLGLLRKNEPALYYDLISDFKKFWDFDMSVMFDVLKKQPHQVVDNWKECLDKVQSLVSHDQRPSVFITKSRWYHQLPIKFFEESLKTYNDPEKCMSAMGTLALLTDGKNYTKMIEPFIPKDEKIDVDHPGAKDTYSMLLAITEHLQRVNPPVSLDIIARFCVGDHLQMALRSLTSVCCRVPVVKVISVARELTTRPVSVKKHGIRLMCSVAPLEVIYTLLTDFWNSEGHTSIRLVVFNKISNLFYKQPDSRSWSLMQTCLDNLNTDDDETLVKSLHQLWRIPNEYLHKYIKSVLDALRSMGRKSEDPKLYIDTSSELIRKINGSMTQILPEEYCQDLIKEYVFVFDFNAYASHVGERLAIVSYLMSSKDYNEPRYLFFGDFFRQSVEEYWDKPKTKHSAFYPMNYLIRRFFDGVSFYVKKDKRNVRKIESFLEIFQSALQPCQDAVSYVDLIFCIEYLKSQTFADFGSRIAQKIPELVGTFSSACIISMSNRLLEFIQNRRSFELDSSEEILLTVIEVLVGREEIHCVLFAANMLFENTSKELNERHKNVIHALRNSHHPSVSWCLNERLASFKFCACIDN